MSRSLNSLYSVTGISKQAVNKYRKRQIEYTQNLQDLILEADILRAAHPGCGVEKMYYTLKPDFIGRDRFIDIMVDLGYRVKRNKNYIRTTIPAHYKFPNLIEGSLVTDINQVWQSDITYILVGQKYFYLVFIIDVYSRRIIGSQASDHLRATANVKALNQALRLRKGNNLSNLIHHSDRGSQYISKGYTSILKKNGIEISMGQMAIDNPYAERVNGTIKNEYLKFRKMRTLEDLKRELRKSVKHYNEKRIHNSLPNRMVPVEFENKIVSLIDQKRPTVTIYTDGYDKIMEASSLYNLRPEENLGIHICPILLNNYSSQKTVNLI